MPRKTYTDEEKQEFVDLAEDIGVNRARRQLGYPQGWQHGERWCNDRGVVPAKDELTVRARATKDFYKDEELIIANQDLISRAQELARDESLTAQDLEKLSATLKRCGDQIRTIQGKNVSHESETDKNIAELLHKFDQSQQAAAEQKKDSV